MNIPGLLLKRRGLLALAWVAAATGLRAADIHYVEEPEMTLPRLESMVPGGLEIQFLDGERILMSGQFAWVNDEAHGRLLRLNADGSVDDDYRPEAADSPFWPGSFVAQRDGTVYAITESHPGWRTEIRRLAPDGSYDPNYRVVAMRVPPRLEFGLEFISGLFAGVDGRMLVSGSFEQLGDEALSDVALLNADGSVNPDFKWTLSMTLDKALPLADGRWVMIGNLDFGEPVPGGGSSTVPAEGPRVVVVRVLANGALDPTFAPAVFAGTTYLGYGPHAFALDGLGRVVFAERGPEETREVIRLGRLLADGRRDPDFSPELPVMLDPVFVSYRVPAGSLIYIPPQVSRIVAADDGAVLCFAHWQDPAFHGVLGVADDGTFAPDLVPYRGAKAVRWLRRDVSGDWWGEFSVSTDTPPIAGIARLADDGTIDPTFVVKATAFGRPYRVSALPGGAVAVEGSFNFAGGVPSPGIVIIERDGQIRHNRAPDALPWSQASLVAVLADGSLLAQPTPPPASIATVVAPEPLIEDPNAPLLGRLFPDGSWQTLVTASAHNFAVASGWLDADGRVLVHTPGRSTFGEVPLQSDVLRFNADGSLDASYRALDEFGALISLIDAAPTADRRGVWGLDWSFESQSLVRLNASGQVTTTVPLRTGEMLPYMELAYTVAAVDGGAVLGGAFRMLNGVRSPGLARVRDDGTVDPAFGGWLATGSAVTDLRAFDNGALLAFGHLQTIPDLKTSRLFSTDGLPLPDQPEVTPGPYDVNPWLATTAGDWLVGLEVNDSATGGVVRRWRAAAQPAIHVVPSRERIVVGDTLTLGVDWSGVPTMGVVWYRDGVVLDPQPGSPFTFVVRAEDEGVVFWAFVQLEGGGGFFTRSWRLEISGPSVRLTNASIRALTGAGEDLLILGGVLASSGNGRLLTRALGPALGGLGVAGHAGPVASDLMRAGGTRVDPPQEYSYWRDQFGRSHPSVVAAAREVGAYLPDFGWFSGNDQMLYEDLGSGAYHFHVMPLTAAGAGVVLAELFAVNDSSIRPGPGVRNFSGRAALEPGDGVLIGGFVVEGNRAQRVLLRGIGPGLSNFGVANAAANPRLDLHAGANVRNQNDDWSVTLANRDEVEIAQAATGAFALVRGSRDAAIVVELEPGIYTVVVRSDDPADVGRVALLEIYALE